MNTARVKAARAHLVAALARNPGSPYCAPYMARSQCEELLRLVDAALRPTDSAPDTRPA